MSLVSSLLASFPHTQGGSPDQATTPSTTLVRHLPWSVLTDVARAPAAPKVPDHETTPSIATNLQKTTTIAIHSRGALNHCNFFLLDPAGGAGRKNNHQKSILGLGKTRPQVEKKTGRLRRRDERTTRYIIVIYSRSHSTTTNNDEEKVSSACCNDI